MKNGKATMEPVNRLPKQETLKVVPLSVAVARFHVIGETPLVMHAMSEKARKILSRTEGSKIGKKKEARVPQDEFNACRRFVIVKGKKVDALPPVGFKKGMVHAATYLDGMTKVAARGAFHVCPGVDLIPIIGPEPTLREDITRIGMDTPDVRWRPQYLDWSCEIEVHYIESFLSGSDIFNLLNWAGKVSGLGENRPQKGGDWGMYRVEPVR